MRAGTCPQMSQRQSDTPPSSLEGAKDTPVLHTPRPYQERKGGPYELKIMHFSLSSAHSAIQIPL